MKKIYSLLVGALFLFASCDDDETITVIYFPDIIEDIVENILDGNTLGLDFTIEQSSELVNESITDPKETYSHTEDIDNEWGNGSSKYTFEYNAQTNEQGIEFIATASGEYETTLLTSDDKAENNWNISDISADSDFYSLSGESTRIGTQYTKLHEDNFESNVELDFENIEVNRVTGTIKQGVVSFTFEGVSSTGEAYTSTGKIQYSDYERVITID